ncbi:MAG: hypothetical protein GY796_31140 [Chloroflexi bacterium]|nr:hypothetical protein [Chloroflexota bacterium]
MNDLRPIVLLSLPLQTQSGLELDFEARPQKSPRPFCTYVQVPHQIKLVLNPSGGYQDSKAALCSQSLV